MARKVPQHPEGWKFKGSAGRFTVWHAGKNDYRVTEGAEGPVIATRDQFGSAYAYASHQYSITEYYEDRAKGGQAALTAH